VAVQTEPWLPVRSALRDGLADAERRMLAELELVRGLLGRALDAAVRSDQQLADELAAEESEFDRRYGEVHDCLLGLMARQSPVAGELRLAMALLHANDRVERMAAQCLNIATLCCALPEGARPCDEQLRCLSKMARLTDDQIAAAGSTFAERDIDGVARLLQRDAAINEENRRCFDLGIADCATEGQPRSAFFGALMARAVERIADNAVDIGRQAAFAVTGRLRTAPGLGGHT
jgi:phosphate transport system protein